MLSATGVAGKNLKTSAGCVHSLWRVQSNLSKARKPNKYIGRPGPPKPHCAPKQDLAPVCSRNRKTDAFSNSWPEQVPQNHALGPSAGRSRDNDPLPPESPSSARQGTIVVVRVETKIDVMNPGLTQADVCTRLRGK